jgi:hypothetical protein
MGNTGIISVIPKDFSGAFPTMEKSLRDKGMSMFPGTFKMFFPYKEYSGVRRTGLDPEASYINNMKDPVAQSMEREKVAKTKARLEKATGLDLSPDSKYWEGVFPVKLSDSDNVFDLQNPIQEIAYSWLRVHPLIASSIAAYERGEFLPETHFYVKDETLEAGIKYKKNKLKTDAFIKVDSWSLPKRRKVARLLGLPIDEETPEEVTYNALTNFLNEPSVIAGPYKGMDSLTAFGYFSDIDDNQIYVRDLVGQALSRNIYREGKGGRIMEGERVVFQTRADMEKFYFDEDNQGDLIELEKKVKFKELAK